MAVRISRPRRRAALPGLLLLALAVALLLPVAGGAGGGFLPAGLPVAQAQSTVDYDTDDDNLIEISSLAQLDAIRRDLDGNGAVHSGDSYFYGLDFSNPAPGMGCPAYTDDGGMAPSVSGAAVRLSRGKLRATEGAAASVSYRVRLNTNPGAAATVAITGPGGVTLSSDNNNFTAATTGITLNFTSANWSNERTVYVKAATDSNGTDATHTLTHNPNAASGAYATAGNATLTLTTTETGYRCDGYELARNLDFDANNNGTADAGDHYWNSGLGWRPIAESASDPYNAVFEGNGYTIANLYINRPSQGYVGMFGRTGPRGHITGVGLPNANVTVEAYGGALVGRAEGRVTASWVSGSVSVFWGGGGLIGYALGRVSACYSHADVTARRDSTADRHGAAGLVGWGSDGGIVASYAAGAVTDDRPRGLVVHYNGGGGSISNSYWDSDKSGTATTPSWNGTVAVGKTTSQLRTPTAYGTASTDIYRNWNLNVDGQTGADDPWDFGTSSQYPVLKYGVGYRLSQQGRTGIALTRNNAAITTLAVTEGGSDVTYQVALGSKPAANVTLTVTSSDPAVVIDGPDSSAAFTNSETLTFTTTNWSTKQTIRVRTPDEDDADSGNESLKLTHAATGASSGYHRDSKTLAVSVTDDDAEIDYDSDDDDLIEITTLAQLDAIRHDRDGNGVATHADYAAAFPFRKAAAPSAMGCAAACTGYELAADLDFAGSSYASGAGWTPIGTDSAPWITTFDGNGHSISNLFINRTSGVSDVGLFGRVNSGGVIRNLGLPDVSIDASFVSGSVSALEAGALVGLSAGATVRSSYATGALRVGGGQQTRILAGGLVGSADTGSTIAASWSSVAVTATSTATTQHTDRIGGLVGRAGASTANGTSIIASYATGDVSANRNGCQVGGLAGQAYNTIVNASYAIGTPTCGASGANVGGLVGSAVSAAITNSYWDQTTTGITSGSNGAAQTTSALQTPTEYGTAGIYANWNVDVDGVSGSDDPWDFGSDSQYPALQFGFGGRDIDRQRGVTPIDYDVDDNGLIEVATLAQLDAMRYDLDGNGRVSDGDYAGYKAAFPGLLSCAFCRGYELTADLDFDTGTAGDRTDDAYYNSGVGWTPIGTQSAPYTGEFHGRGYDIRNLYINTATIPFVGLFGAVSGSLITGVGLPEAGITVNYTNNTANEVTLHAGALAGLMGGNTAAVRSSYTTGSISLAGAGTGAVGIRAGGLIGDLDAGTVAGSWSSVAVTAASGATAGGDNVGGLVGISSTSGGNLGFILASYATGNVSADRNFCRAGGLVGYAWPGTTVAGSYSTGTPDCGYSGGTTYEGGLVGQANVGGHSATITNSYWDQTTTGISTGSLGAARTTGALQSPTRYTGIYGGWNVDVDGVSGGDNPWNFGTDSEYPTLHYLRDAVSIDRERNPGRTEVDYDSDDNNLIDVKTLAQLEAIDHDLSGNGVTDRGWRAAAYAKAFPGLTRGMGCRDECEGYELKNDLDFAGSAWASGSGWNGIGHGGAGGAYNAKFAGNGYTIANLLINLNTWDQLGLFQVVGADAEISGVGLPDVNVTGDEFVGALAGTVHGRVSSSWSTGSVTGRLDTGGLVGVLRGEIAASWSSGTVRATHTVGGLVGRVGQSGQDNSGARIDASYSRATVRASGTTIIGTEQPGGLVGQNRGAINASYAAGAVSSGTTSSPGGGLVGGNIAGVGGNVGGTVTSSYWDTTATGRGSSSGGGTGLTTTAMQSPTAYGATSSDTYYGWNLDLDNADTDDSHATGQDDPWDFGHAGEYPVLKYGVGRSLIKQGRNGIVLTRNGTAINALSVDEGASAGVSYGVALADPPAAGVTVTVASGNTVVTIDDGSGTFGANRTLTFTTTNWADAQTVTVKAGDDTNIADDTVALTHTGDDAVNGTSSGYDDAERTLNLTVTDTTTPSILLTQSGSAITALSVTEEGSNVTYDVGLSHQPTGTVTVTIAATGVSIDTDGDSTFSASETLEFTTMNWNTAQTVTVRAPAHDANTDNETGALAHSGSGGGYGSVSASLSVTIVDNDQPRIALTRSGNTITMLTVAEEGSNTYTVALATQPTADVSVTVTASAGLTIDGPDAATAFTTSETLSFTGGATGNWGTAQTITVRAAADDDLAPGSGTLSHSAADATPGSTSGYGAISASLPVMITDNDTPSIVLSETGTLSVDEGDSDGATYTVRLSHRPAAGVTVTITSSGSDDVTIDGPDADTTFSDSETVRFTTGNWDTAQTVTVKAATDNDLADDTGLTLAHAASDTTPGTNSLFGSAATVNLSVTATDTTTPTIRLTRSGNAITTLAVTEQSQSVVTYNVALSHQPTAGVTVTVASSDSSAITIDGPDSGATFSASETMTFTAADYGVRTVTVRGVNDGDSVSESVTLTHTAADTTSGMSSGYDDPDDTGPLMAVSETLSVSVTDNDTPNLVVSESSLTLTEATAGNGHQDDFTVRLNTLPTGSPATVTVVIASNNDDVGLRLGSSGNYGSSVSLTFDATGTNIWSTDQTVNVQAADDADGEDDAASLTFSISGGNYGSVTQAALSVTVTDNDTKGITFDPDPPSLTVTEGTDTGSYTVQLATQPTAAVTVGISSNNSDVTIRRGSSGSFGSSASLSFSTTNWNAAQTVQVKADEDNDSANDTATLTHTGSGGGYGDGATGPLTDVTGTLSVTVTDDDTPGIRLSRTALTITEQAARQTYTVRLNTQPSATVTVAISKTNDDVKISDDDSDYTSPVSLSFSTTNWDTPQTVYVRADNDADGESDADTLTHDPSGGDYNSVSNATLALTVTDNDTKAIVLDPTSLSSVNEGTDTTTYNVSLATAPTGTVTVAVSSDNAAVRVKSGSGNFGSSTSLTFDASNYTTTQPVTVEAVQDDNSVSESVTISHVGSGGGYGDGGGPAADISQNLSVSVADDDTPSLRVSASSVSLNEATAGNGHQSSFNVRLNTQPTGTVTVGIASDNDDVRVRTGSGSYGSSVSLSFTGGSGGNYGTDQAVNVRARQDLDGDNDTASLSFNISGGDYNSVTQTAVSVTVDDDDPKGITIAAATTPLAVSEGAAPASYTIVLDTQPSGTVRVTVSSSDPAKVSVSRRSGGGFGSRLTLSFNTSSWNTPQTVYVRGNADDDTVSETGISLAHTASGGGYAGISASLSVALTDTSTPGLVISPSPLSIKETTERDYTVRLATQPASSVTVTISRDADSVAVTFDHDGDGTFGAGNQDLTFTVGNWNRPQAVKVRAPAVPADDSATLSHTAGGADYGSVSGSLTVNVRDNLPPVAEAGAHQQAYSGQTITLEGSATDPDDAVSTLTYAWRQSGGTPDVTLAGADTANPSFTVPTTLTADMPVQFELTVTDPSGRTDTDTVRATLLAARPNELVSLQVSDRAGNRPLTPPFASIRRSFEASVGAYATTARIILMPADDAATVSLAGRLVPPDAAGVRAATVHLAEGSNRYTIVVTPAPVAAGSSDAPLPPVIYLLNIRRQPVPRLSFAPARIVMDEGATATYTVNLDTRWLGAAVTVTIASDNPAVAVSPASVQFTPTNWAPRTVTITAGQDDDGADDTANLNHRASGGHFDNVYGRLRVAIEDDDGDGTVTPNPTPTPTPTPEPGATPTPTPTPGPTPTPTPPPGLPTVSETNMAEALLDGHTVTITREAGSLWGVSVALPATLTRDLAITIAPLPAEVPRSSERFGLGMTDAAQQSGARLTVTGAPAGGIGMCLPLSDALVLEANDRPLTLVRYDAAADGWQALPGAVQREMTVCAAGVSGGTYAAAYIIIPPLGPASELTVTPGDASGALTLRWTPGAQAMRHWVAGIKQSDWDANDFSSLIWTAASASNTHTLTGLDRGAEYVFTIAAGRRVAGLWEWSDWTTLARGKPQ